MMPPICCICDEDFDINKGGLIYFSADQEDNKFNERFKEPGYVGHPSNAFWFCEKHYKIAVKYKNLTKKEAFKQINKKLK